MCMQLPRMQSSPYKAWPLYSLVFYIYIYIVTFHYRNFDSGIYKLLSVLISWYNMGLIALLGYCNLQFVSYSRIFFQVGSTPSTQRRQKWSKPGWIEMKGMLTHTTTHVGFCDIPFMSLKVLFSLCFIICDACVTKITSSPIPCNKKSSTTKTSFFVINFMTIILSSLIYDAHFS